MNAVLFSLKEGINWTVLFHEKITDDSQGFLS